MPIAFNVNVANGPAHVRGPQAIQGFNFGETPIFECPYVISGVTKDSTGAALGSCVVDQYDVGIKQLVSSVISDASGNYSVPAAPINNVTRYQCIAYKAGSPDVAGITRNDLVGI